MNIPGWDQDGKAFSSELEEVLFENPWTIACTVGLHNHHCRSSALAGEESMERRQHTCWSGCAPEIDFVLQIPSVYWKIFGANCQGLKKMFSFCAMALEYWLLKYKTYLTLDHLIVYDFCQGPGPFCINYFALYGSLPSRSGDSRNPDDAIMLFNAETNEQVNKIRRLSATYICSWWASNEHKTEQSICECHLDWSRTHIICFWLSAFALFSVSVVVSGSCTGGLVTVFASLSLMYLRKNSV